MESVVEFFVALFDTPAVAWRDAQVYGGESYYVLPLVLTVILWIIVPAIGGWLLYRACRAGYLVVRRKIRACRTCGNSYACCACQVEVLPDDEAQTTRQIYH